MANDIFTRDKILHWIKSYEYDIVHYTLNCERLKAFGCYYEPKEGMVVIGLNDVEMMMDSFDTLAKQAARYILRLRTILEEEIVDFNPSEIERPTEDEKKAFDIETASVQDYWDS